MTWFTASWRAVAVFAYFAVATVWLPDFVIKVDAVATAEAFTRDLVVFAVWAAAFGAGMWLVRFSQRRGFI